jgi:hypothetical protein
LSRRLPAMLYSIAMDVLLALAAMIILLRVMGAA